MDLQQAREIADDPIRRPRAELALALDVMKHQVDRLEADHLEAERQRMLTAYAHP